MTSCRRRHREAGWEDSDDLLHDSFICDPTANEMVCNTVEAPRQTPCAGVPIARRRRWTAMSSCRRRNPGAPPGDWEADEPGADWVCDTESNTMVCNREGS